MNTINSNNQTTEQFYCGYKLVDGIWICVRSNVDEKDVERDPSLVWVRNDIAVEHCND